MILSCTNIRRVSVFKEAIVDIYFGMIFVLSLFLQPAMGEIQKSIFNIPSGSKTTIQSSAIAKIVYCGVDNHTIRILNINCFSHIV